MNCHEAPDLLEKLVDGEATPDERAAVEGHLEACEACRSHLSALQALQRAARRGAASLPQPDEAYWERFPDRVLARVGPERSKAASQRSRAFGSSSPLLRWGALAASVLIAAGIGFTVLREAPDELVAKPDPAAADERASSTPSLEPAPGDIRSLDDDARPSRLGSSPAATEAPGPRRSARASAPPQPPARAPEPGPAAAAPASPRPGAPEPSPTKAKREREQEADALESLAAPPSRSSRPDDARLEQPEARLAGRDLVSPRSQTMPVIVRPEARAEAERMDEPPAAKEATAAAEEAGSPDAVDEEDISASNAHADASGEEAAIREFRLLSESHSVSVEGAASGRAGEARRSRLNLARSPQELEEDCEAWRRYLERFADGPHGADARYELARCTLQRHQLAPDRERRERALADVTAFLDVEADTARAAEMEEIARQLRSER